MPQPSLTSRKFSKCNNNKCSNSPFRVLLQVQGFGELFGDSCEGVISWLNGASYYTAFTEGWALYAENPLIAEETDTYDNNPLQLYGMLKWQIWRALRLMMDTGLHYKGSLVELFTPESVQL